MPTIFSHGFCAASIGSAFLPAKFRVRFIILTAACAMLPDADVISFFFGIAYGNVLGHRGITHSILFAIAVGCVVGMLFFRGIEISRWRLALYFSAATLSHPLLDMLTSGGLGVALLAPFSNERFFFPWRPITVSPIGLGFFSERGVAVVVSEFVWIWLPSMIIATMLWLVAQRSAAERQQ
jgi:inner membrane protein